MEYKEGQKLQFNIYNTIVEGIFIRTEGNSIIIKTTKDLIETKIGEDQSIHKSHPHKEIKS